MWLWWTKLVAVNIFCDMHACMHVYILYIYIMVQQWPSCPVDFKELHLYYRFKSQTFPPIPLTHTPPPADHSHACYMHVYILYIYIYRSSLGSLRTLIVHACMGVKKTFYARTSNNHAEHIYACVPTYEIRMQVETNTCITSEMRISIFEV